MRPGILKPLSDRITGCSSEKNRRKIVIELRKYKKVAPTQARMLTSHDFEERSGLVDVPEGIL